MLRAIVPRLPFHECPRRVWSVASEIACSVAGVCTLTARRGLCSATTVRVTVDCQTDLPADRSNQGHKKQEHTRIRIASGTHSRTLFPADSTLGAFLQNGTLEIKPGVRDRQYNLRVTWVDCAALLDPTPLSLFSCQFSRNEVNEVCQFTQKPTVLPSRQTVLGVFPPPCVLPNGTS